MQAQEVLMRLASLILCVLGLAIGVSGRAGVAPAEARWRASKIVVIPDNQKLPDGTLQGRSRVEAKNVEIRIGDAIITAEAADVAGWRGAPGPVEIVLTGNVRVKTVLNPIPPQW
jgi:hypothetical protein